jgi:hypothetical protein
MRMAEYKGTPGELIYEYTLHFTKVVEYGISANAVFSGQMPPPAEGARFDVYFEGPITGPKLKGTVRGVDYLHIRADGRCQLNIHAEITTEDGRKIALASISTVLERANHRHMVSLIPHFGWLQAIECVRNIKY